MGASFNAKRKKRKLEVESLLMDCVVINVVVALVVVVDVIAVDDVIAVVDVVDVVAVVDVVDVVDVDVVAVINVVVDISGSFSMLKEKRLLFISRQKRG